MIRTFAAILAARRILLSVKSEEPSGLELALAADIIRWAVEKDEAEQEALKAANVVDMREPRQWRR